MRDSTQLEQDLRNEIEHLIAISDGSLESESKIDDKISNFETMTGIEY
jgi:hypothetical protein